MSLNENEELESARILIQENLIEEAKRLLFRLIARIPDVQSVGYRRARELLSKIEAMELHEILNRNPPKRKPLSTEEPTTLIRKLEKDLMLEDSESPENVIDHEIWCVSEGGMSVRERFDLAVGFFEMECFADAIRELKYAEKKIRIEETFLGDLGISIVALRAHSLIRLGQAFNAKIYLEPILLEPDLKHEKKIILYYTMGLAEEALEENAKAKAWFTKVLDTEPGFKDVQQKMVTLSQKK